MNIRETRDNERQNLYQLHLAAFGAAEGNAVGQLVLDLLAAPDAQPQLSLTAELDDELVGHVLFTPVAIEDDDNCGVYILCPLAVTPTQHSKGIGTTLIQRGLENLGKQDAQAVLVLGDPKYYFRSGFHTQHQITAPYPLHYPEAWMAQALQPEALNTLKGTARCASPLQDPRHW